MGLGDPVATNSETNMLVANESLEAMLRWHSFIPALAISSLLLMLLEHQRIRRIYQLLEGANSSQDGVSISYARNVFDWRTF